MSHPEGTRETASRAAAGLRLIFARPHSDEYRHNSLGRVRLAVARAIVRERVDPALSRTAQRRWLASRAAYDAMMTAYHDLPETEPELLAALDALAGRQAVGV